MRIAYTPEQERLRQELRAYFAGLMTPEVRAALSPSGEGAGGTRVWGTGRRIARSFGSSVATGGWR